MFPLVLLLLVFVFVFIGVWSLPVGLIVAFFIVVAFTLLRRG